MKYLKRIYNNIKYILSNDLMEIDITIDNCDELLRDFGDNLDKKQDKIYDLENSIDDVQYDMDNKLSYDDVVDEINDRTVDTINDVKELKVLCDVLTKNNDLLMQNKESNNNIEVLDYERDLLINEVIKTIIDRLKVNENV